MENGNIDARFSPAAAQGALPRFAMIIKLFPKAFNIIEQTNHNVFTGRLFIMTSDLFTDPALLHPSKKGSLTL